MGDRAHASAIAAGAIVGLGLAGLLLSQTETPVGQVRVPPSPNSRRNALSPPWCVVPR